MLRDLEVATVSAGTAGHPRSSEGAILELRDGSLLIVFQRYEASEHGSEDFAPSKLVSMRSRDGGRSWGGARVEVAPEPGDVNVYSPNLVRRPDGAILFVYQRILQLGWGKPEEGTARARVSRDEGATFSAEQTMWGRHHSGFPSSSIRILRDGTLVLPLQMTRKGTWCSADQNIATGTAVSGDGGLSWKIQPAWITLPMRGTMEGHLEELKDGRLMMIMRTQLGALFKAYSADRGITWSKPQTTGVRAPEACPELLGMPDGRLMLVWNNGEYDPAFRSHYGKRSPLSVAVSEDEGESFRWVGDIERDPRWAYSNPGAYFLADGTCLVNYWATEYAPDWLMSGLIHLRVARFRMG